MRAAITETFSIHTEMFWMGGRAGWPGACGGGSSREISDISTKSNYRIFLATLGGSTTAGLQGPLLERLATGVDVEGPGSGAGCVVGPDLEEEATVARRCKPMLPPPAAGENVGRGFLGVILMLCLHKV